MIKWLGRNLRTFGLALVLAIAVWVSAVTSADPDEVHIYTHPVTLEIVGQDSGMVIRGDVPKTVTLTLRAPHSVWDLLNSDTNLVRAVIDLAGLSEGEHKIDVQVQINARPVRIITVDPASVDLTLEALASKSLPIDVTLTGEAAVGYQPGVPNTIPSQAVISGPISLVNQAARIQAVLPITAARQDIQSSLPLRVLSTNGQIVSGLTITPEDATISLPITQQGGYRDIAVKVVVLGQVAGGYRLANITVNPPILTVFSQDPTLVNTLPGYIETEPLNLNGASQNIDTHLKLTLPNGITVVGDQTVEVQVGIAAIEGSITLNGVAVGTTGLANGLSAQLSPANVDVIISGPLPALDNLTSNDLKIVVDLTGLTSGTHQVVPQVIFTNSDVQLQSINPATIEATIGPKPSPGPSPSP